ncbi:uncharacterized protein N7483_003821 [Penicillium malachiteum]|uniref:uncharacterized protein n=1 Tax=Penicillium malachiteum TaxID=1324776 RepID=UPI00254691DA|nr:uncharacterized protein N7483_003821 [Penicillium malachiteum]KAJ5729313.1 hypothetical protein N7483_003821 [Penicillium malachiteum]
MAACKFLWGVLFAILPAYTVSGAAVSNSKSHERDLQNNSWHRYIRSPSSDLVKPQSIPSANITGNVTNPNGLLTADSPPTILTRKEEDTDIPSLVIDFGQNVVGIVSINFAGSYNSSEGFPGLKLAFSETQQYLTNVSDFTRSDNMGAGQKLTNGTDQVRGYTETPGKTCSLVCSDGLHGFRYMRIWLDAVEGDAPYTQAYGAVSISSIELKWSAYLGTPDTYTGWFECSDEDLTQWWYDSVYTTDMDTYTFLANETDPRNSASPTLQGKEVIFDGAKRDRDPYVGDLVVAALTSYLSHDNPDATRNILADLADHQRSDGWIPPASINNYTLDLYDYPMWWVICTADLVMYTGDTDFATKYYDVMKKTLDNYYGQTLTSNGGLLNKTNGYGDYAFLPRSGVITYYNALYIHALQSAAQLANILNHPEDSRIWTSRASAVSDKLLARNWDSAVGAFFDGGPCPNDAADTICNVHAQDGNGLAVLSGSVNSSLANSALDYYGNAASRPYGNAFYDNDLLSEGFSERVYAFISYFELAARFAIPGASGSAIEEIKRLYGWMSTHDPEVTFWEGIGANGSPYEEGFTSMAHGWSTGIVPLMSNYMLGVRPTGPGFKTWQICPVVDAGDLTWARGEVGTPQGPIQVSWSKSDNGTFEIHIEAPEDSSGVVCVPTTGFNSTRVLMDGKQVRQTANASILGPIATSGDGYELVQTGGGSHTIVVGV